ncbi:Serine acetyltransferase (EC [Olavius sp. associated proteobacterium Delta 1]|nr:Serine acetyltransferase (EC [Olavius sp. associated proteobacterium Delta 1]
MKKNSWFGRLKEEASCYADGKALKLFDLICLVFLNNGFQLNLFYRMTKRLHKSLSNKRLLWLVPRIMLYLERLITGSVIDPGAKIGCRFKIIYGMNIVIGEFVEIGNDVIIFNGVSLGSVTPGLPEIKQPKLGSNIMIGTGAKILGDITIGDNVKIGANAVVLNSFESNVSIAGVPAKVIRSRISRKEL